MIIEVIKNEINNALEKMEIINNKNIIIDKSKNIEIGDFSSNVALIYAKENKKSPIEFANELIELFDKSLFKKITVTNPGFINFFIAEELFSKSLLEVLNKKDKYLLFDKKDKKYSVEYVSANPTGYLHIGHSRNGVLGDVIKNLLITYGYDVITEYVVNDAGNQMNNLATAVFIRYLQIFGNEIELPKDSYHGEEIKIVAQKLKDKFGDKFIKYELLENQITDVKIKDEIKWFARCELLEIIKSDLKSIGVEIEIYTSEQSIRDKKLDDILIEDLIKKDKAYKKDGAIWLRTTDFGDEKDRVLVKSDQSKTYFAPDIVYHDMKWKSNNVDVLVNIWGADHYSYITRMKAAMKVLGYNPDDLIVICLQMVKLTKNGAEYKMSKRTGSSLTLRDLVASIGKDPARWFLLSQSVNSHIEIDVDIATKQEHNNPYYYVQYANARANQLLEKKKIDIVSEFKLLNSEIERELIVEINLAKYTIESCVKTFEPYKLINYLYNLAKLFHKYYSNVKIFEDNNEKLNEQYSLIYIVKMIIGLCLDLLGIEAKIKM